MSHDRRFLDNVVTQTLSAEGDGLWRENVGGYSDWLRDRQSRGPSGAKGSQEGKSSPKAAPRVASEPAVPRTVTKLSYKETRELAALPDQIEALEREQSDLTARMGEPDYHRRGADGIREDRRRLGEIEALLTEKYGRWERLEGGK